MGYDTKRLRELSGYVAVVGIGDTDYAKDYRKRGEAAPFDSYGLAATAFKRALEDSGLKKEDIDGVASCRYVNSENIIDILGLTPRWGSSLEAGESMVLTCAIQAIFSGMCDTVAVIYGNAQRSKGARYGGPRTGAGEGRLSEQYYHPWGWTSTGAHYAMMWQVYMDRYGAKEEDLGQIPVTLRRHAMLNDRAVMRTPITIDDYMASRYVCRPLHLFDYCIINDGGACLILRRADMANDLPHHPVLIDGLSWNSVRDNSQLRARMLDLYQTSIKTAGDECFAMAGMGPKDIDHFQNYDGFSVMLALNLEGFGFCKPGEMADFIREGNIELGGQLPCNTSGGMLSESYMHGWNLHIEAVRQLRHEAGARQVQGAETSMYCHHGGEGSHPFIYRRA